MAVYVDDMNLRADVPDGGRVVRGKWSHLFADTHDELLAFAKSIGLRAEWIQHEGEPGEHFDVTMSKRAAAVSAGATQVTWHEAGRMIAARRERAREMPEAPELAPQHPAPGGQVSIAPGPAPQRHGRYYPPDAELPDGICPGCRSAELASGRDQCQACGLLAKMQPPPDRTWPDLSHGQPGHMCVQPVATPAQRELQAGG